MYYKCIFIYLIHFYLLSVHFIRSVCVCVNGWVNFFGVSLKQFRHLVSFELHALTRLAPWSCSLLPERGSLMSIKSKTMSQRPPSSIDFETELANNIGRAGKAQRRVGYFGNQVKTRSSQDSKLHTGQHLVPNRTWRKAKEKNTLWIWCSLTLFNVNKWQIQ